jgi:hypothetical protein
MVRMQPSSSNSSNSLGMTLIALDFSARGVGKAGPAVFDARAETGVADQAVGRSQRKKKALAGL